MHDHWHAVGDGDRVYNYDGCKKLYVNKPEICCDNYLSHDVILDYAGKKGFVLIFTVQCNRLPKGVPSNCMHKYGTYTNAYSKAERYL